MSLASCSASSPYSRTAETLATTLYAWYPIGVNGSHALTDEESLRSQSDLKACVSELSEWLVRSHEIARNFGKSGYSPGREERVAALVSCMEMREWYLAAVEIVVTS
jgi:hypothetical protein